MLIFSHDIMLINVCAYTSNRPGDKEQTSLHVKVERLARKSLGVAIQNINGTYKECEMG